MKKMFLCSTLFLLLMFGMAHAKFMTIGTATYNGTDYTSGKPQSGYGLTETGDFENLIVSWNWSGTECANSKSYAWFFKRYNRLFNKYNYSVTYYYYYS